MKARICTTIHTIIAFAFMLLVLAHADIETDNRNYHSKSTRTKTRPTNTHEGRWWYLGPFSKQYSTFNQITRSYLLINLLDFT